MIATIKLDGRINRTYYDELGLVAYSVQNLVGQDVQAPTPPSASFRTTVDGTRFWSDTVNHSPKGDKCTIPGCDTAQIMVSGPLPVTVRDSDGKPQAYLPVYAFNGSTYVNVSDITDANGQVFLTLVDGSYRFQAEVNGVQFWSAETNHYTIPGCSG